MGVRRRWTKAPPTPAITLRHCRPHREITVAGIETTWRIRRTSPPRSPPPRLRRRGHVRPARFRPDPSSIIDPPDPRLSEVLKEVMHVEAARLENFLGEARDKAGQLRAIIKLPAREPQAFREKLVLILELIRGIHARAKRLPLPRCANAPIASRGARQAARQADAVRQRLPAARREARRPAEPSRHPGRSGGAPARLARAERRHRAAGIEPRSVRPPRRAPPSASPAARRGGTTMSGRLRTQKASALSDLSQESLEEMAHFLADMYSKTVSLVCVGLEDVPRTTAAGREDPRPAHPQRDSPRLETPADRVVQDKPEIGTVAVQFQRVGADGYQLSVQDDGRGSTTTRSAPRPCARAC
jgi:hypothetical protein